MCDSERELEKGGGGRMCVRARVYAVAISSVRCVCACVRACVRACVCERERERGGGGEAVPAC